MKLCKIYEPRIVHLIFLCCLCHSIWWMQFFLKRRCCTAKVYNIFVCFFFFAVDLWRDRRSTTLHNWNECYLKHKRCAIFIRTIGSVNAPDTVRRTLAMRSGKKICTFVISSSLIRLSLELQKRKRQQPVRSGRVKGFIGHLISMR